ncbi:MAG TPA: hypothetical protein VFB32_09525 [Rudaea sp.]|nr:hypothetical protein [Rudaea sp.]
MPFRRLLVLIPLLAAGFAAAQVPPRLFDGLAWRFVGPFRGGRVLTVSGIPGDDRHFYFGAVNGGVWKTEDAGRTWQPIFDGQGIATIGAIALAPSAPDTLYVGTGEADMRSDIAQGDGVYKSTDGGRSWRHIGLADTQQIGKILVDPRDANFVYVAALGHPYGPNAERGVFRSRDGGAHWQKVLGPNADTGAIDIVFAPDDARTLFAALWQTRRPPWNVYPPSNGPGSGVYKSTDGGDTWTRIAGAGFPASVGRVGFAVSPAAPRRVYALVDGDAGGLYRSDDAGATWHRGSADPRIWQRGWYFGGLAADPRNADRVFAMNTLVLRSEDGGATFTPFKGDATGDDYHTLWIDPTAPERQILGSDQGAQVTLDGGTTWSSWHNQPTAQIYHLSTDSRFPYRLYGAQQDSGALSLPSRGGGNDGINMTEFTEVAAGGESDNIAPDPADPDLVFGGRVDRLDLRTQQVRHVDPTFAEPDLYRRTWTLPLAFSRRDPRVLYFANQRLFRTEDGGEHWTPISGDLTREAPDVPKTLDASTAADNLGQGPRRGVIYAIAPSRTADRDIWVGTDDGLVWRTQDEGIHWENITPRALTAWSKIGVIEPSPFDAGTAYIAVDRHRLDDFAAYIYRTNDGGKHWSAIASGIPAGSFVNVVRADPTRRGLLYAGTEKGVYVSFDDGAHWQSLQKNLPVTSVRDIDIHDADLVIATHGRGFWILDDVSALRQADATVAAAPAWLYAPHAAVRVHRPPFFGTPLQKDEPLAANPPDGAHIDYVLAAAPKTAVTLDILDGDGTLVRRYTSEDAPPKDDPTKRLMADEWVSRPATLAASPGMHRFVWPLHYAAPAALADGNPFADGVWAPPGDYTIALLVDGQRLTQKLRVEADPRVHVAESAYAQEFAVARAIEQAREPIVAAAQRAEKLLEAIEDRRKRDGAPRKDLDAFAARVHALAGTQDAPNPHNAWAFPPVRTETLRFVGDSLEALQQAADDADAAPSPDVQAGFAKLRPIAAATLAQWHALEQNDLAALNAKLRTAGLEALVSSP